MLLNKLHVRAIAKKYGCSMNESVMDSLSRQVEHIVFIASKRALQDHRKRISNADVILQAVIDVKNKWVKE